MRPEQAESRPREGMGNRERGTGAARYSLVARCKQPLFPVPGSPFPYISADFTPSRMSGPVDVKHVPKPWGHETIWALTDRYCGKVLHINAGHALSVQYHNQKDETIHLLSGRLAYWVKVD